MKQTNLERYGVENTFQVPKFKEKSQQTCLKKYGTKFYTQTKECRQRQINTSLNIYGYEHPSQCPEIKEKIKQTNIKRYGVPSVYQCKEILDKMMETRRKNKTFGTSKDEIVIYNLLIAKFNNVLRQYHSELYPFACDFYVVELDLYIEYQGMWTHGKYKNEILGPFNEANIYHTNILNIWTEKIQNHPMYASAIKTWTIRDPLKRKTAKDNDLNWLEFWTIDEFMQWYNSI